LSVATRFRMARVACLGVLAASLASAQAPVTTDSTKSTRVPGTIEVHASPSQRRSPGRSSLASASDRARRPAGRPAAITDSATVMYMVRSLAHPRMEGRGAGTAGLDSAAALIAGEMRWLGLEPGGDDGTYFQRFEVTTGVSVGEPCGVAIGGKQFPVGDHFQPLGFSNNGTLTAPVVFAGYGISAPGYDYDDYAGIDVRDKLVLVLSNEPGEMDSTSRFDGTINTPHAEVRTKAINAREHGALGLLVVNGPRHHAGEPLRKPRTEGAGYMTSGLLAAYVSEQVAEALLAPSGLDLAKLQSVIDASTRPHGVAISGSAAVTVTLKRTRASIKNVIGWIPGRDSARTLVVGAHYDHLGYGGESSLAPDSHLPHLGADDNASGVAAMLSVAAWRAERGRPDRAPVHNLVFCAFAGEEMGLVGSSHFVDDPTLPLPTVEAMINMDMVGRLRNNRLMVMGIGTAAEFPALTGQVNERAAFDLKTSGDGYGPSDHSSFYKRKVPVLALFTGAHTDYHKPTDSMDRVDAQGLWRVALFARDLVDSLDRGPRPTFQQAKSDSTVGRIAGGGGYGAYLGTIPDYMQTEGGVLLSGVRTSSPADSAGLKGGDVIVRFDGVRVDNIYDYTFALRSRKPGQQVRITVKRGGGEVELLAVLGRRK
jgi:peptidase M28-like protein/PDZ domain-containing protein/PA domain-containing protein